MDILNAHTLEDVLMFCDKRAGVHVGIACADEQSAHTLIESFWDEISSGHMSGWQMGRSVDAYYSEAKIMRRTYAGASYIEIFNASSLSAIRGRSYHMVLCDANLSSECVCELYLTERLSSQCEEVEDDDGKELDEFLNSFKIV